MVFFGACSVNSFFFPSSTVPEEVCLINTPSIEFEWFDFLNLLTSDVLMNGSPFVIISSKEKILPSKHCSVVVVPVDTRIYPKTMEIIHSMMSQQTKIRFSKFIFVIVGKETQLHRLFYNQHVEGFKLMDASMVSVENSKSLTSRFKFLEDKLEIFEINQKVRTIRSNPGYPLKAHLSTRVQGMFKKPYINLMESFARHVNATLSWIPQLDFHNIDVFIRIPYMFEGYESIPDHKFGEMCLLVPQTPIKPYVYHLFKPYENSLWVLILVVISTIIGINTFLRWTTFRRLIWQTMFGLQPRQQEMPTIKRFILQCLSTLKFILLESYATKLLAYILNTVYEPPFRTVAEFNRLSIPIRVANDKLDLFLASIRWTPDLLILDEEITLEHVRFYPNQSYLAPCEAAELYTTLPGNIDPDTGLSRFYVLKETISWLLYAHVFVPLNPLIHRYESFNDAIFTAGIWNHWAEQRSVLGEDKLDQRVLKFGDLISLGQIIIYGSMISLVVLCLEWIHFQREALIRFAWRMRIIFRRGIKSTLNLVMKAAIRKRRSPRAVILQIKNVDKENACR